MANRKSIESRWLRPLVRFTEKELKMFKHPKLTELSTTELVRSVSSTLERVLCRYDVTFEMNTNLTRTEIEEYRTYLRKVVNHRTPANGEDLVEDLTEKCENDQADSFATRTLRRAIAYTIASSIRPTKTARMLALDAI